jgi:threonine synthase
LTKHLVCQNCGSVFGLDPLFNGCPQCSGALETAYDYDALAKPFKETWQLAHADSGLWRFAPLLPMDEDIQANGSDPASAGGRAIVSLGEGSTPLVKSRHIGPRAGLPHLCFKNETLNPTWAQKDRAQAVMLTKAREFGYRRIVTTSTGNHGASAAAYATAAGMEACVVLCPHETSTLLLRFIGGFGGTAIVTDWNARADMMKHLVAHHGWYPATGFGAGPATNPYGIEGYKSVAYEIVQQLGCAPEHIVISVASGDSFYGVWKGFRELHQLGYIAQPPRMWGCQPAGADVLARTLSEKREQPVVLSAPHSIATSTREPTVGAHALRAVHESGGGAVTVEDEAILDAMRQLGREGVCVEPASALTVAAALQLAQRGEVQSSERVVCLITAAGIKWPDMLEQIAPPPQIIEPTLSAFLRALHALALESGK